MKKHFEYQNTPCTVDNIVFMEVVRNKGYSMSFAAGVSKNKFVYIREGGMLYSFGSSKKEIFIDKGEMLFIPAGFTYTATYTEDNTCAVQAQFDLVYGVLPLALREPDKLEISGAEELMLSLIDRSKYAVNLNYYRIFRVYELLWRGASNAESKKKSNATIEPAIREFTGNFAQEHKISYYAELCAMSESGFRKQFKDRTGLTPIEFRNNIRIEEAAKLIDTGEYTVQEAALAVGFNNISFFCRCYKKRYGHTPKGK